MLTIVILPVKPQVGNRGAVTAQKPCYGLQLIRTNEGNGSTLVRNAYLFSFLASSFMLLSRAKTVCLAAAKPETTGS